MSQIHDQDIQDLDQSFLIVLLGYMFPIHEKHQLLCLI